MPAAPRGLFYHGSDKGFRALGLSESTVVRTTDCSLRAWANLPQSYLRALRGAERLLTIFLFLCIYLFLRSEICAEHATFVFIFSYFRQNAFQYL